MDRPRRWWPRRLDPVAFFVAVLVAIAAYMFITNQEHFARERKLNQRQTVLDQQQRADLQCIANYLSALTSQTAVLRNLNTADRVAEREVQDALRAITTASLGKKPVSAARSRQLLTNLDKAAGAYQHADDAYNKALKTNPLPQPLFVCSDRLTPKPSHTAAPVGTPVVTYTAVQTLPGSTTTRTYTVAVPQPVPDGVQTVTVTVPGKAHGPQR